MTRQSDEGPRSQFASSSVQPDLDLDASTPITGNKLAMGTRLDEYEISAVLGEGGFGIVYLAWDHSLQRRLAIKEYMPSSLAWRARGMEVLIKDPKHAESFDAGLRSFINEAKLLASFDHPSLLKVHRFFQANGTAYMVMPFYEGVTLKEALAGSDQPPDERWLRELLQPLLAALEYLHDASCYHRDIAPDNVLLVDEGRPLLLDFGAARRVIGDLTKAVTVILKPGYAPIEQYGDLPGFAQGPWTDLYALGAVLHFAITGQVPRASVTRLVADDYVPLAQRLAGRYSAQLLKAIDRMLVVRPEGRPQTIGELRQLMDLELSADSGRIVLPSRMAPGAEPWARNATRSLPLPLPLPLPPGASPRSVRAPVPPAPAGPAAHSSSDDASQATVPLPIGAPAGLGRGLMIGLAGVLVVLFLVGLWRQLGAPPVEDVPPGPVPASASEPGPAPASAGLPPAPPASTAMPEAPAASATAGPEAASAPSGGAPVVPASAAAPAPTPGPVQVPVPVPVPAQVASQPPPAASTGSAAEKPRPGPRPMPEAKPPRRPDTVPSPAAPAPSPRISNGARCADIIQRVSIGEALTAADRRYLQEECGK